MRIYNTYGSDAPLVATKVVAGITDIDTGEAIEELAKQCDCGGHSDVTLDGVIGGAWSLSCDGRVAGFFNNNGTLAQISCDVLTTAAPAVSGRSATQ